MIHSLATFDDLPWDWMEQHRQSNAYRSATFLKVWLKHRLGRGAPWGCVFTEQDQGLRFVAPLAVWRERHLWTTVRMVRPIGWDEVYPSVCVPFSLDHLRRLGRELYERKKDWDVLEFAHVTDEPALVSSMAHALRSSGLRVSILVEPGYPYVKLSGPWAAFYREKSRNLRKDISRLLNKMRRLGVQYRRTNGHDAYAALEPLFELHRRRWSRYGLPSVYSTDTYRAFMHALCRESADARAVAVHSLLLERRPIAVTVCLECGDAVYAHHTAFDEDFARFSPGKVLLSLIIRDAFERRFKIFDPNLGRERYKYWWTNASQTLCWFRVSVNASASMALWSEDKVLRPPWRATKRVWRRLRGYRRRPAGGPPEPATRAKASL